MKFEIEIPDDLMVELDTAVKKHNARAQAQSMATLDLSPADLLEREFKGWLRNFILSEHHLDLLEQTEEMLRDEGTRLSAALSSSSPTGK